MKYVIALDQGTTSSRAVVFDAQARMIASHSMEYEQLYPQPGWVEHRPEDILRTQVESLKIAVQKSGVDVRDIAAIGITNQRQTSFLWERATGRPICNAIVWQCRRTAPIVEKMKTEGLAPVIREKTGLILDAFFSSTKIKWMLDNVPGARERAEKGELCFGTVDSFLAWNLTGGKAHVTDVTNAAQTMLYNIYQQKWDEELLAQLDIPASLMPKVVDTSEVIGMLDKSILGREIPIAAMAGDQQAALFGQGCVRPGMVKNTYGTGCFVLMNTGDQAITSGNGLLTTVGWRLDGKMTYVLEGSVFVGGAVVQWLRDELHLVAKASETEAIAASLSDNGGVYLVPAFTGLGAPYWDMYSRGTIVGLTRGSGRAHIVRAALESIAYQSADVVSAMAADAHMDLDKTLMRVDGGACANNFLMQFQSDILGVRVLRPKVIETTAMGAAMLAGRAVGLWSDADLEGLQQPDREFMPLMPSEQRAYLRSRWAKAVSRAKEWEEA